MITKLHIYKLRASPAIRPTEAVNDGEMVSSGVKCQRTELGVCAIPCGQPPKPVPPSQIESYFRKVTVWITIYRITPGDYEICSPSMTG